jgi:hypothetical protein
MIQDLLQNILKEFELSKKLIRLIKVCLNETCGKVRIYFLSEMA